MNTLRLFPNLKILLVDDDDVDRMLVMRLLRQGFPEVQVTEVSTADDALQSLEEGSFHLVVSDLRMPGHDGYWLLERAQEKHPTLPVVVLTAQGDEQSAVGAMKAGATDYILKNALNAAHLKTVVRNALRVSIVQRESRQAELAVRESEHRLRLALEASGLGVWELSLDDQKLTLDEQCQSILAQQQSELPLSSIAQQVPEADRTQAVQTYKQAIEGDPAKHESKSLKLEFRVQTEHKEAAVRSEPSWLCSSAYVLRDPMQPTRIIGTLEDVTQAKREEQARRRRVQFQQQLMAIVSHDLRSPLSAMLMGASLLHEQLQSEPSLAKVAQRILSSGERANRLINELLDFTQAHLAGGIPISKQLCDITIVCRNATEEARMAHPGRQIDIETSGDGNGSWDAERLSQALSNLIENALAYSPDDSLVTVRCHADESRVRIEIHNQGDPIPAEKLPHLFEPFKRASGESRSKQSKKSIGLGLFIVSEIAKAHAGTIEVSSTDSDGTRFRMDLPKVGASLT